MNGWVKLHRKTLENVELMHDDTARLLFFDLLLLSNSKGQIGYSTRRLAKILDINHSTVRKALSRLVGYKIIQMRTQSGTQRYTLITICNWSKYQSTGTHFGTQWGHNGDTTGTQKTGVARIENKNKESDKPAIEGAGYRKARMVAELLKTKTL